MKETGYKISYSQSLLRVRLSMTLEHVVRAQDFPIDFVQKSKERLLRDKDHVMCKYIRTYEEDCQIAWKNMKSYVANGKFDPEEVVHLDLVQGCPILSGYTVKIDQRGDAEFTVGEDPQSISEWPFAWFYVWLVESLAEFGYQKKLHMGMVSALWRKLRLGEDVSTYIIGESPKATDREYVIVGNKEKGECYLQINDFRVMQSNSKLNEMIKAAARSVEKISKSPNGPYSFYREFLIEKLRLFAHSGEKFGVNYPLLILVGSGRPITQSLSSGESAQEDMEDLTVRDSEKAPAELPPGAENYPGRGLLKIEVSDDKMEAWIQDWTLDNYDIPDVKFDRAWLQKEIDRHNIKFGVTEKIKGEIINTLRRKEDIQGIVIAQGKVGEAASGPYLYPIYKDVKPQVGDSETINIRDLQERTIVNADELVAVLRYQQDQSMGTDVYGNELEPEQAEKLEIIKGDGVVEKKYGEYYAKYTGMPIIEDKSISVSKMLIHEGDVNLRSGNVRFDGPVEIKGSIDAGCIVECTGGLVVNGAIRGGQILVGGDIEVKDGIITTKEGNIRCKGNIKCEFIENSRIICSKNIVVKKVILNSEIYCGGSILADIKEGRIAGGRLCVDKVVECASMGTGQGVRTEVDVGRDWKSELAIEIRRKRHDRLKDYQTELKKELNTLKSRSKAQMTKKHEALKEKLTQQTNKLAELVPRARDRLADAKDGIQLNNKAKIIIHGLLSLGCVIRVADAKVRLKDPVMTVKITNKKHKGTYIHSIDDEELEKIKIEREALLRNEEPPDFGNDSSDSDDEGEGEQQAS